MIFPASILETLVISPASAESVGGWLAVINASPLNGMSSGAYPSTNRALFVPFSIFKPIIVQNLFCINGSAVSGNIDIGVYSADGTKIISSGSTAQSGTSAVQAISITATKLTSGLFYLAIAMDNASGALFRTANGDTREYKVAGMAQMASAFPLPTTATFATVASAYCPLFGLSTRSVV